MSRFDGTPLGNDGNRDHDERISQLFDTRPKVGEVVICDNCHANYEIESKPKSSTTLRQECPHCAHMPQHYSLTRVRLEKVKSKIGWGTTGIFARKWWRSIESNHANQLDRVLGLALLLESNAATIDEFYQAHLRSGARGIGATLSFMEFLRTRLAEGICGIEKHEGQEMPKLPGVRLMALPTSSEYEIPVTLVTYLDQKLDVIKVIKHVSDGSLMEIKRLVESAPVVIGRCATEENAEIVVNKIKYAGGDAYVGNYE